MHEGSTSQYQCSTQYDLSADEREFENRSEAASLNNRQPLLRTENPAFEFKFSF